MKIIYSKQEWVTYTRQLNDTGVAGAAYEFQHIESPEMYPCGVHTIVDDHPPAGSAIALVHVFFYEDDANALSRKLGVGQNIATFDDEAGKEDGRP